MELTSDFDFHLCYLFRKRNCTFECMATFDITFPEVDTNFGIHSIEQQGLVNAIDARPITWMWTIYRKIFLSLKL